MKPSVRISSQSEDFAAQEGAFCSKNGCVHSGEERTEVEFLSDDYALVAEELMREIEGKQFLSATLTTLHSNFEAELILTLIIYRTREGEVSDVVPVWWEMHTYDLDTGEEFPNDFSFGTLREGLISKE